MSASSSYKHVLASRSATVRQKYLRCITQQIPKIWYCIHTLQRCDNGCQKSIPCPRVFSNGCHCHPWPFGLPTSLSTPRLECISFKSLSFVCLFVSHCKAPKLTGKYLIQFSPPIESPNWPLLDPELWENKNMEDLERGSVEEEDFNKCRLFLETYL